VATTQTTTTTTTTTTKSPETLSPADLAELLPPPSTGDDHRAATTTPSAEAATAAASEQSFDFEKTWYPLAIIETLKTDRPNALTFIGKDVVVWRPLTAGPQQSAPPKNTALETDALGRQQRVTRRFADGSFDDPTADGWVVQSDLCPHRLAPLSEGRLETDGAIQCSYHGWRFDAAGKTALIPQLEKVDPSAHARACSHPKSCVAVHPCRAFMGVLWVWGEAGGADVALRAATTPPTCVPKAMLPLSSSSPSSSASSPAPRRLRPAGAGWYSRDVPVATDVLLENFVDPSHVPFSHNGVIGSREADQGMIMRLVSKEAAREGGSGVYCSDADADDNGRGASSSSPISRDGGYSFEVRPPGLAPYLLHFRPPGHAWFYFPPQKDTDKAAAANNNAGASSSSPDADPERVSMLLFATPTKPGWSRVFVSMISPEGLTLSSPPVAALPAFVRSIIALLDKFPALQHALNRNAILDGDDLFLAAQQRALYANSGDDHTSWRDKYYLPASTDVGVAALRRWIDVHGRKMPFLPQQRGGDGSSSAAAAALPVLSREETFDRYTQHTKDCPHCSAALRNCERALWVCAILGAACAGACLFGAAAAALKIVAEPARAWVVSAASAGVAVLCALVARGVWGLRGLFVYYDYQHADH
jgi:phenylpropionate dioxygenase-like ring-hydroxylating dioxygenase large terminal subunit